jgi:ABC-type thiamin/hydroxymethylpyrimidine transport system permease subunit
MQTHKIYTIALESVIVGIILSMILGYIMLDHNPQQEFYDTSLGRIVLENLAPAMAAWFLAGFVGYGIVRLLIHFVRWRRS